MWRGDSGFNTSCAGFQNTFWSDAALPTYISVECTALHVGVIAVALIAFVFDVNRR